MLTRVPTMIAFNTCLCFLVACRREFASYSERLAFLVGDHICVFQLEKPRSKISQFRKSEKCHLWSSIQLVSLNICLKMLPKHSNYLLEAKRREELMTMTRSLPCMSPRGVPSLFPFYVVS